MPFLDFLNRLLGDPNERELKRLWPRVRAVEEAHRSPAIKTLALADLPQRTQEFRDRLAAGVSLNALLPEVFALVVHACELLRGQSVIVGRQTFTWDMVPFPVQILGGIVLHEGRITEMKTGEGKTLVCTMPVYLNALAGKGVHVITVNDYLARRDSAWMGMLYGALGLNVGTVVHGLSTPQRKAAYACDVTYGTNNEFGFDYLRDNMATRLEHQVQRGLHYAIVDEVDSILIDEARTPLIISQPAEESTVKYRQYAELVRQLQENVHYNRDEKQRTAVLTEEGIKKMEQLLDLENIYTAKGFEEVHHIEQALRAHAIYERDVDYVVKEGEVIIVDEFTGRLMPGRRYSHGLHQAIEAKEGVEVQRESKTLATITFQNYFRLYGKLAGMTGTARTEEEEFESIYTLRTVVIPTHRPMVRADNSDAVYRTVAAKFHAVARLVQERHARGQPILIGTTSIEKSEALSTLLTEKSIAHQVLNAKHHEKEAEIVARAGGRSAATIATNMAGRGTDIKLGPGVQELGGLLVIGTERHEARRIDNQLRGRSGRQGDPGESQFFVSMEDDLMRLFGGDRLKGLMARLNVPDDVPLQTPMVSRAIEGAQKRVEGHNFDLRRHVLQYDMVLSKHREIVYKRRQKILLKLAETERAMAEAGAEEVQVGGAAIHEEALVAMRAEAEGIVHVHCGDIDPEKWNVLEMMESVAALHPELRARCEIDPSVFPNSEKLVTHIIAVVTAFYEEKCRRYAPKTVLQAERVITLRAIDTHWMDHIDDMAHLREQVAFAGFAQRDPLIEYQDQGFRRFQQLLLAIQATIVRTLLQVDFAQFAPRIVLAQAEAELENVRTNVEEIEGELTETGVRKEGVREYGSTGTRNAQQHPFPGAGRGKSASSSPPASRTPKMGRNDPCPCGSGRKFKKCHGK